MSTFVNYGVKAQPVIPSKEDIVFLSIDGEDIIGLSITDAPNIQPELWPIFFVIVDGVPTEKRADAEIVALALASPYLNMGYMIGDAAVGIVLYPISTPQSTLTKALKYVRQYSIAWPAAWGSRVKLLVSGSDAETTNQIIKVRVHHGEHEGDYTNQDIFCDKLCKTDFSDVRFALADGTLLPQWRASYGNWEFIPDSRLAYNTIIDASGNLWTTSPYAGKIGLCKSTDNSVTWIVKDPAAAGIIYVANNGDVFTSRPGGLIYRSAAADDGANPVLVLTLDSGAAILRFAADEDSEGRLFFGQYQAEMLTTIYRSTENGVVGSWTMCLRVPPADSLDPVIGATVAKGSMQHIHGLAVDPYTDYVYAGADSAGGAPEPGVTTLRTMDHGDSWEPVWMDDAADSMGFVFYPTHRLFGGESGSEKSVVLTTDDTNYTTVISRGTFGMLAKDGSTVLAGGSTAGTGARYPQLFLSKNEGLPNTFETILMERFNGDVGFSAGHEYGGGYNEFRTPIGGDRQLLVGADETAYYDGRFYNEITGRHEAEFKFLIPAVPAAGVEVYAYFGNGGAESLSDHTQLFTEDVVITGLTARYKLDGTVTDSAGGHNGTLIGGAWLGRRVAECSTGRLPYARLSGDGLVLAADGHVDIDGSDSHVDFNFTKNFSIACWIERVDLGSLQTIISKGDYAANNGWALTTQGFAENPTISFKYSNGSANTTISPTTQLRIDQSYQVGIVVDNASPPNIRFILNGQLQAAQALAYEPVTGAGPVVIGALGDTGRSNKFDGNIGDIRFYKGKQLTQNEITQIYEHRAIPPTNEPTVNYVGLVEPTIGQLFPRVDYTKITGTARYVGKYALNGDGSHPGPAITTGGKGSFNNHVSAVAASASSGDGIITLPGAYKETLNPLGKNIYIVSVAGPLQTLFDLEGTAGASRFTNGETTDCIVDGFTLTRGAGSSGGGFYATTGSPTIRRSVICNNDLSALVSSKGAGIFVEGSSPVFENVAVFGNKTGSSGIGDNIYLKTTSAILKNVSVAHGTGTRQNIQDYSTTTTYTNVIADGGGFGNNVSSIVTYSNIVKASLLPGTGNLNTDPLFVSATDLRLQAGSPCRNTGTVIAGRTTDILGNAVDVTPNMGAYE